MTSFDEQVLAAIGPLRAAGFALHWLHTKDKRPIGEDWSTKPVASLEALRRRYQSGNNLGVRLGEVSLMVDGSYLHVIDLDIRDEALASTALAQLLKLFPDAQAWPCVQSGSGGSSRHFYFLCSKAFPSKKLARSESFKMVFDPKLKREVKKRDWEIELFGTGKQVAMPPSIHPETGKPYIWIREFDFDALSYGVAPTVTPDHLERLGVVIHEAGDPADIKPPLGLTLEEARDLINQLPIEDYCEDRDGWVQVGMALHHEFGGSDEAAEIWEDWSRQSEKFNEREQRIVWNSFRAKANSVRMATLKGAVNSARLLAQFEEVDADDSIGFDIDEVDEDDEQDEIDAIIGQAADDEAEEIDEFDAIIGSSTAPALGWTSLLQTTKDGDGWTSNLHNLVLIVGNDPRLVGLAQLNEFTQETVQRLPPGRKDARRKNAAKPVKQLEGRVWNIRDTLNGELWSDDRDFSIRSIIEAPLTQGGYGIKVSDRDLKAAIVLAANNNAFHPVREYLTGVQWDGVERMDRLFVDYLGSPDSAYTRSVGRLMMIGAVTRIFEPGHKFDFAVILEGMQGKRKSTFIQTLGKRWFAELDGDFHDPKMMIELMQGAWILELPELTGFQRSDVRAIKAFISRQKDRARLAYARRAGEFPRQCIFIGSTNDREYLKDDTGGRRFWPMPCNVVEIDTVTLAENVDQLWAEAVAAYQAMRKAQPGGTLPLYLVDEEAREIAAGLQESRRVESSDDGLAGIIGAWLDQPINNGGFDDDPDGAPRYRDRVCAAEIWVECMRGDMRNYGQASAQSIGRSMRKVEGWVQEGQTRHPLYGSQRTYKRVVDYGTGADFNIG